MGPEWKDVIVECGHPIPEGQAWDSSLEDGGPYECEETEVWGQGEEKLKLPLQSWGAPFILLQDPCGIHILTFIWFCAFKSLNPAWSNWQSAESSRAVSRSFRHDENSSADFAGLWDRDQFLHWLDDYDSQSCKLTEFRPGDWLIHHNTKRNTPRDWQLVCVCYGQGPIFHRMQIIG